MRSRARVQDKIAVITPRAVLSIFFKTVLSRDLVCVGDRDRAESFIPQSSLLSRILIDSGVIVDTLIHPNWVSTNPPLGGWARRREKDTLVRTAMQPKTLIKDQLTLSNYRLKKGHF